MSTLSGGETKRPSGDSHQIEQQSVGCERHLHGDESVKAYERHRHPGHKGVQSQFYSGGEVKLQFGRRQKRLHVGHTDGRTCRRRRQQIEGVQLGRRIHFW